MKAVEKKAEKKLAENLSRKTHFTIKVRTECRNIKYYENLFKTRGGERGVHKIVDSTIFQLTV